MAGSNMKSLEKIYPLCRSFLSGTVWGSLLSETESKIRPADLPRLIAERAGSTGFPDFLPDLALLEWTRHKVSTAGVVFPREVKRLELNPTLEVIHLDWKLTPLLMDRTEDRDYPRPERGEEWVLVWRASGSGATNVTGATTAELLAVKMIAEDISPEEAAAAGGVPAGRIERSLYQAADQGILLAPPTRIRRQFPGPPGQKRCQTVETFTVQWHITNACDLHCRHCYDRSRRPPVTLKQGLEILDDLHNFCRDRHVKGHVCFTGGNPFMYPRFFELYRGAVERGFAASILGNPTPREQMKKLIAIQPPGYFQVSLEGLREHNDVMREAGHFGRVIEFLKLLRELEISSAVMLTLTKDNIDQVLPLAKMLEGKTDHFTFNRLSPVGEGADLQLPSKQEYIDFLDKYADAFRAIAPLGYKDNLINIVLNRRGLKLFDGCSGYGCGAAFNFITILPDGEAHACRKFPSPIGNVLRDGIPGVYDSELARRYRQGPAACRECSLRPVCGGCMAITRSFGLDIFTDRDPFCFKNADDRST